MNRALISDDMEEREGSLLSGAEMRLRILGAAQEVTGSNYLLEVDGRRVLVDCGLYQGANSGDNHVPLDYDPSTIDAVLLTHAHLDHTGKVPLLVKQGYKGPVYGTRPTLELCDILWRDAAHIQKEDAEWQSRKNMRKGLPPVEPLYTLEDVERSLERLRSVGYDDVVEIVDGLKVRFRDAGHILGSAILEVWLKEGDEEVKVVFSGDLGPQETVMEANPAVVEDADFVVIESTYGNRNHKTNLESREEFRQTMKEMLKDHGKVLIPTFVVDRAQRVLYELKLMQQEGILPDNVPIYFDSPMGMKTTAVYSEHISLLSAEIQEEARQGRDPFTPKQLHIVESVDESKAINNIKHAIVLAGSGMCNGGRIVHHLKNNLFRENAHVVFVGYQAKGTLGRRLIDGSKVVRVAGEEVSVKAKLHTINGFSAHADRSDLLAWAKNFKTNPLFIVTHGEPEASGALAASLQEEGFSAVVPKLGQEFVLSKAKEVVSVQEVPPVFGQETFEDRLALALEQIEQAAEALKLEGNIRDSYVISLIVSAETLLKTAREKLENQKERAANK
ncbi:MAG: metallo-beta-lactamase family protein [Thermovirga sp.]|jgi:metallo-beta-lactamase family protein|nr:metallo-beta-lactamase family protein [Thermovirga sp.]